MNTLKHLHDLGYRCRPRIPWVTTIHEQYLLFRQNRLCLLVQGLGGEEIIIMLTIVIVETTFEAGTQGKLSEIVFYHGSFLNNNIKTVAAKRQV